MSNPFALYFAPLTWIWRRLRTWQVSRRYPGAEIHWMGRTPLIVIDVEAPRDRTPFDTERHRAFGES